MDKIKKDDIKLTIKQLQWLSSRGGRNENDVEVDDNGKYYVWMGNGNGPEKKVYVPRIV